MPTIPERLETSTASVESDAAKLNAIVNGAADAADVVTTGGNVKTIAKVIAEAEAALGGITGGGLRTKVAMPANTAASGADGQYAIDAEKFAVYRVGTGWIFYAGYQI